MNKQSRYIFQWFALGIICLLITSCRKDPKPIAEDVETLFPANPSSLIKGVYILNEGNLNMNKASLDYVDYTTGLYRRNTYNQANPEVTRGLGDVGNDMAVYGSKLYVVLNNSNKIEVLNAKTGKRITQINLVNCRYITFNNNKAYASAYLSSVGDPNAPNGIVAEIDTTTLLIERRVTVGRQPEEMAVVGNKLYVANSGGYSPPNYERTLSVVDLISFNETKRIDVAINLQHVKADRYGDLYVNSQGDYLTVAPKLYVIDTQTDRVKKVFDLQAQNFCIDDDLAYVISTGSGTSQKYAYNLINIKEETLLIQQFITDGSQNQILIPYGMAVNPLTKEVLVTDAKDYVSPGTLYCINPNGSRKWSVTTGDIPAHFAFIY
ncbi:YncE family protein [Mucilaginibacter terrae]|uniref:YncE family protein n=1 Tax=Mucilaginibacter terrae TaxID=1955052 RepID=UPI003635DEEB